jgi:hypothetical protein
MKSIDSEWHCRPFFRCLSGHPVGLFAAARRVLVAGLLPLASANAAVINPSFESGLLHWILLGEVLDVSQQAVLQDSGVGRSLLWQTLEGPDGPGVFGFDYLLSLSGVGLPGSVPDVMFASLYFFSDPAVFNPNDFGSFSDVIAVADFDSGGVAAPTATAPGVTIGQSVKGPSYRRLEFQFAHPGGFVAPVFEVNNLNGVTGDSVAVIDNVTLTLVPEPAAPLLAALTTVLCLMRRRRL